MTARTHDLAAFTALVWFATLVPLPQLSVATIVAVVFSNMMGGLAPDIDEPTTEFWQKLRGGSFWCKLFAPLFPGHRWISHSLVGLAIAGWIVWQLLQRISSVVLVDMNVVWWGFMVGYVSHLITDSMTKDGVPWLFPIPIRIGIPPIRSLRITTGKLMEKAVVFPGLILLTGFIVYKNYSLFLNVFRNLV